MNHWKRLAIGTLGVLAFNSNLLAGALNEDVEQIVKQAKLDSRVRLSITIIDAETGRELASHNARDPMIPASNMKLLTSAVAADVLGSEFAFETRLLHQPGTDGAPGRIIVLGSGDPAFADPALLREMDLSVDSLLETWIAALRSADLLNIAELIVDDRIFDRDFVHPTWPEAQLNRHYCAEVAGLNFHTNIISIYTEPTREGAPPAITTEPLSPWITIDNRARTVGRSRNHTAWASRKFATNEIGLHGDVRHATTPVPVTLHNIPDYFAQLLADRIRRAGGSVATVRTADMSDDFSNALTLHIVKTPISVVLERCNVDSNNLYAEALIKRLGHETTRTPGSWANGATVVRMKLLDRIGPEAASQITVADGSGMSRQNRVTTSMLAQWLRNISRDQRIGDLFVESLPTIGEGTLRRRMLDRRSTHTIRAKSGYLSGVSALSGYVIDEQTGRRAIFSVISNDRPGSVSLSVVRNIEEEVILLADEWLSGQLTESYGGR